MNKYLEITFFIKLRHSEQKFDTIAMKLKMMKL